MSGTIPQSFIQDLICRIDIVDIIKSRLKFTKEHANNCIALCPFHREKTPSFSVSRDKQFYYCFGCGANGNVIKFLMEFEHLDFITAIEMLAQQAGIKVPYERNKGISHQSLIALYDCMAEAICFYEKHLKNDQATIDYLKSRGLIGKAAKYFHLGSSPNQWHALTQRFKHKKDLLLKTGLIITKNKNSYDRFRNRLIFPIRNTRGKFIGIGARTLTQEQPKYINSPETDIFHKNQELYGLYESLQQQNHQLKHVLVVEGYMDVISLFQHGITYAVATLGTAINHQHLYKLLRYTPEVVFCFDGDTAGKTAAKKALSVALSSITDERKISFMFLPKNEDPDTLIQRIGKDDFEKRIDNAVPLSNFFFDELQKDIPLSSLDDKARFAKEAINRLGQVPNGLFRKLMEEKLLTFLNITQDNLDEWLQHHDNSKKLIFKKQTSRLPKKMHPGFVAMALLLNNPSFIALVDNPRVFENLKFKYSELLTILLITFKAKQNASIGYLFEVIDQTYHTLMVKLSTLKLPSLKIDAKAEFIGAITRLNALHQKESRQRLIDIQKRRPLTKQEKEELRHLLKQSQSSE